MSADLISVLVLVAIFAVGTWRPVNMGAVALVAAFLLGTAYFGLDTDDIASGFPASLFITLVGVTFLFGLARANGTVDWLVSASVSAVRGRVVLIPWVMFLLAAIITGIGAISAATNAILVPIGLAFAQRYRINPMLVGLSILNGTNAGGFSPIAVYYTIVEGALDKGGVQVTPTTIFLATFLFNLALNLVAFTIFGGWKLWGRTEQAQPDEDGSTDDAGAGGATTTLVGTRQRIGVDARITLGLLVALVIGAVGFDLDVGFLALTAAVLLIVFFPAHAKEAASGIAWNVVLLIGGIVTYVSMLQEVGVVDSLGNAVAGINAPLLASLLILLVGGLVSAFASTNAMFGALVPLTVPFVLVGDLSAFAITAALCVASSTVDSSPFSTGGALVVANTEKSKQDKVFRSLMVWGMSMIGIAPIAAWLIFVLPAS
ncbi:SLC13 family permease [Saccharopolyspora mangrovi]|uniref:SLC13 family permease n=1 Tax=Saccharopolyspora mangrovi TaxID=3082379 RepID=A0ABU6ADZ8_9PSEU|nr:SLC13 family permease [Saccharopolyspora sp. S2-29]MEB3369777.1 SLC13 family permease [Saccharopolyspora sp. S2-29]